MKCYHELCIYQKDNACTLDMKGMEINSLGMCEHCEVVSPDEETLAALKNQRLTEISERWAGVDE